MVNILVTGAAGFIGSHLAEHLAGQGHRVYGLDCFTDYYARALKELNVQAIVRRGVTFWPLDLAEDDLAEVVRDVEVVYHSAAQPGLSASCPFETYMRNNVTATYRLLEAVKGCAGLRMFVYLSTSSVYGVEALGDEGSEPRPTSYYGVTKLAAEQLALSYYRQGNVPVCSLRLFSVYGPRERPDKMYPRLIRSILEDREFPLYEGSEHHWRSYTYVDDCVDGIAAVLQHMEVCLGEILNIGTDAAITTGEGIRIVEEIIGKRARIVRRPPRPGDQRRTQANIAKARRLLDYHPATPPREGLAREVEWYRENIFGKVTF